MDVDRFFANDLHEGFGALAVAALGTHNVVTSIEPDSDVIKSNPYKTPQQSQPNE